MFIYTQRCVSCDQPLTSNHKCSARHEAARKAAQTRESNRETFLDYDPPRISEHSRLEVGLSILERILN